MAPRLTDVSRNASANGIAEDSSLEEAIFRCPTCAWPIPSRSESELCRDCGARIRTEDGILMLVPPGSGRDEEAFYEDRYGQSPDRRLPLDLATLRADWESLHHPINETVLRRVGDVRDKIVLLLGNGGSTKELYLLMQRPRLLIVSDLSLEGLRLLRRAYHVDDERVVWAAVDGTQMPIADRSVDLVYGYSFVHHLPDAASFIAEAARVLREGGRSVFSDNCYSPAWQRAKLGVLRPLMNYFHRRGGVSPQDLRATMSGWHRVEELNDMITAVGGAPFFERSSFFHYLFTRASERLPPRALMTYLDSRTWLLRALIRLDETLSHFEWIRRNQMRIVWGFEMPRTSAPSEAVARVPE
jgi:SAM-dependent methyltransferase